jgi:hypothetical protein
MNIDELIHYMVVCRNPIADCPTHILAVTLRSLGSAPIEVQRLHLCSEIIIGTVKHFYGYISETDLSRRRLLTLKFNKTILHERDCFGKILIHSSNVLRK